MSRPGGPPADQGRPALIIVAHRILIGAAILFGVFYAGWEVTAYRRTGDSRHLAIAGLTVAVTLGLAYYIKHLRRF
ncbi:MAG TPA: hypothetical protein VLI67_12100 [Vicinamibacteria bacterium]|nr:hypothetical protein [Vicinamibacteria bacterium]